MQKEQLAPNIMVMVRSFNRVALLVPTEILEEETPQARAKVISAYIKVMGNSLVCCSCTLWDVRTVF